MLPILGMLAGAGLDLVNKFIDAGKDKAVEVIKEKTGIDLTQKKTLSQEDIQKLKEFQEKNREFLLKQMEMFLKDRQNAREMNISLSTNEKVPYIKKIYPEILATIVIIATLALVYVVLELSIDQQKKDVVMLILTTLNNAFVLVLGFYFGSSAGSKEKDSVLAKFKR